MRWRDVLVGANHRTASAVEIVVSAKLSKGEHLAMKTKKMYKYERVLSHDILVNLLSRF